MSHPLTVLTGSPPPWPPERWREAVAEHGMAPVGPDLDQGSEHEAALLHARRNFAGACHWMLRLGVGINRTDILGRVALHQAVQEGASDVAWLLIAHGADLHSRVAGARTDRSSRERRSAREGDPRGNQLPPCAACESGEAGGARPRRKLVAAAGLEPATSLPIH